MYKYLLLMKVSLLSTVLSFTQDYHRVSLSQADKKTGIVAKYDYGLAEEGGEILLYLNGTYAYSAAKNIIGKVFNSGSWIISHHVLVLTSTLGEGRLPLLVEYVDDTNAAPKTKLQWVHNAKGEMVEEAFVAINHDSISCSPLMDTCLGRYTSIDSLKVWVGNTGCSSRWVKIKSGGYQQLKLTIPVDVDFNRYQAFNRKKFRVVGRRLVELH